MRNSLSYFRQTVHFLLYFFKQTFVKSERGIIASIIARRMVQWKFMLRGKLKRATRWFVHDFKGISLMGIVNDRIDDNHNMLQKFVQFVKTCAQYEANY